MNLSSRASTDTRKTIDEENTQERIRSHHIRTFADHLNMKRFNSSYYYMVSGHLADRFRSIKHRPRRVNVKVRLPSNVIILV